MSFGHFGNIRKTIDLQKQETIYLVTKVTSPVLTGRAIGHPFIPFHTLKTWIEVNKI